MENRAILDKPFPPEVIRTRKGAHGPVLYVEAAYYIRRLNEAFDGDWGWTIISKELREGEVVVLGALDANGRTKHAFGGSKVTTKTASGEVVSVADDFKAASTDALKKACSLFGIGLDLYTSDQPSNDSRPDVSPRRVSGLREVTREPATPDRLTAKQLRAIYAIATAQGISDAGLKGECRELFGVMPEYLSRRDASTLIEKLSERES